jgi:gamma-glutamyltranspeptidase/glutathione hydrolase
MPRAAPPLMEGLLQVCFAACLLFALRSGHASGSGGGGGPDAGRLFPGAPGVQGVPGAPESPETVGARGGAIASGHVQATAAGLAVLRDGGNAADAAVATALALAVVYPEAGNLGGGGFAVSRMGGEITALDFRETAPAAARRDMYLDAGGRPRKGASQAGPLAAGVPGSPSGLYELHHALGKLPWARVVAPAIALARDGFVVDAHLHALLAAEPHRRLLEKFPESAAVWLPGGHALAAGTRLRLPALAATLALYAEHGPAAIAEGPVAAAIGEASRRHGGVLAAGDLAGYRPAWRQPLRFAAFGWQVATVPLPSAGGIVLGQSCGMLERLGWAALPRGGADRAHLLAEAFRRAFADRVLLGDPATSRATPADLLDPRWIAARAAGIDRDHATPSATLAPWSGALGPAASPAAPVSPAAASAALPVAVADGSGRRPIETTHLSVIDGDGNAVALTTTLNGLFGCGLFVPEIGFLNNEMDDFATAPAAPSGPDSPPQGEANAVAPGKRMLSSMTPTLAWRGNELIALGGRGSLRIPTHVAQVLLDLLLDPLPGVALQAAIDRPRLHHQGMPDRLEAEPGALSPEVARELARRGHRIVVPAPDDVARINAVRRKGDGSFEAAVDPRGAGALGGQGVLAATGGPR